MNGWTKWIVLGLLVPVLVGTFKLVVLNGMGTNAAKIEVIDNRVDKVDVFMAEQRIHNTEAARSDLMVLDVLDRIEKKIR